MPANKEGLTRRDALLGAGGACAVLLLGGFKFAPQENLLRPPGGQDESNLLAKCIRCNRCYELCPTKVIVPGKIETGLLNVRIPTLSFKSNYCQWCADEYDGQPLCVKGCPTGALSLPSDAKPEKTIIGKAVLKEDWCLAYRLTGCKFCAEACPYNAIELDGSGRPKVIESLCNGCGACESVCVSLQNASIDAKATTRAIVVEPISNLNNRNTNSNWQPVSEKGANRSNNE